MRQRKKVHNAIIVIVLAIIVNFCTNIGIHAQDPLFSQFMFNQLYFNPAFAGNTQYPRLISGYRNQWPGIGNAFVTYYASYDQYSDLVKGGVGLGMTRDIQGDNVFSKTSFDLMYSFPVEFNSNLSANLGLEASLVQKSLDGSSLIFNDQNPYQTPTITENIPNQSKVFPDFSAGASFLYKEQYQINFSVNHLNKPNEMAGYTYIYPSSMRFNIQVLAQYPSKRRNRDNHKIVFRPGLMTQIQRTNNFFGWGSNVLFSSFTGGLWVRNNASLTINSFTLLAGYSQSGFSIYYSYDGWLPKNYQHVKNYGAHEVTFIYLFQYNDPRKKMRIVKCPKF